MNKVLVVGLDGATWDLLMPLAREGFMPNLRRLIESGTHGELESTIPPITGPAWASFATGKNPGKTGIFDFLIAKSSLNELVPVTTENIPGKLFYEILEHNDKRTIMVNLPLSYPPRTESPTITSILTQGEQFIFPASLKEEVPELEEYRIIPNFDLRTQGGNDEYFEDIRRLEQSRFRCAQKLFKWEWDYFFILFSGIDWIQHELYDRLLSHSLSKNHAAVQLFCDIDCYLGCFLERLPSDTVLLLMSDHGFKIYKGTFRINHWLRRNGFLESHYVRKHTGLYPHRFSEGIAKAISKEKKIPIILPGFFIEFLRNLGFGKLFRILGKYIPLRLEMQLAIDHSRTYALCPTFELSGIYLNIKTRFQNGMVEPQAAKQIKEEIISGLRRLKDPITGEGAFNKVLDSEEIYWGSRVELAPDIIILPRNFWVTNSLFSDNIINIFEQRTLNFHSMNGIFLAYGPGIKKGCKLDGAKIYDIAPTILHVLDTPIPRDMDGRVLTEVFEHDSEFAIRPIEYTEADEREQIKRKINALKRSKGI